MQVPSRETSLLVLTERFPPSQEFVAAEVPYLAKHFGRVTIAPRTSPEVGNLNLPANTNADFSRSKASSIGHEPRRRLLRRLLLAGRALKTLGSGWPDGQINFRNVLSRALAHSTFEWAKQRQPPDVVYTYWLGLDNLALRLAWPDVIIVSRAHGFDIYPEQSGARQLPFLGTAVESCDRVYCVSEHGRRTILRDHPWAADRLSLARLGTPDLGTAEPNPDPTTLRIVSVSSVDWNKRVIRIADAIEVLANRGNLVDWTHLGEGPQLAALRERCARLPPGANVRLPGPVAPEEVHRRLLGGVDVFVNVSLSEGAPVSLMEAQSAGLPCVATNAGGSREVIAGPGNCLLPVDANPEAISLALARTAIWRSEEVRARRQFWRENYCAAVNYEAFAAQLAGLVAAPSAPVLGE